MERELPEGWQVVNLPEVVYFQEGPGLRKFQYRESGVPFLNIRTLSNERVDTSLCGFLDEAEVEQKYQHFLLEAGDIICSTSGTIGKTALIQKEDLPLMLNTSIVRFRSLQDEVVAKQFVYYFLKSNWFHEQADEYSTGTAQKNIGPSHIQKFVFPLPPLAEQKRIVAKLDEAFQHLDSIESKWERIVSLHSKYIKACLVDTEEEVFYTREKLAEYLEESTERIGSDWRNITKVGVSAQKGIIDLETGQKETFEKYKIVRPGDFVYNAMRVNIGSIAIYEGDEIGITSPDYIVFRVKKDLSPKLLLGFLKSEMGLLEINANTKGSVRSRLYFKNLANISYPLAPLHVQEQAEQVLSWYSSAISKWRKTIEPSLASLSHAILAKAFRGELVPQDHNDEPASLLLEKIKAAKAGAVKPAKGKKVKGGKQGELVL